MLQPVTVWTPLVCAQFPDRFIPGELWSQPVPLQAAQELADWALALLGGIWPESAQTWTVGVKCKGFYEASYLDVAVLTGDRSWLMHLGVSD